MNRPPGQGFPYDEEHEKPAEYGAAALEQRTLCGYPLVPVDDPRGPVLCTNTAPCPVHRNQRVDPERDQTELLLNIATNPAPGLHEAISGHPLPSFGELRERYGDPEGLNPIPKYDPDSPADLHDQLHADDQPWSVKSRLAKALGRRALATRLADALPPLLGAELADRLDTLVTQALTEQEASITQQLSDTYHAARARLDADAADKLKAVHDERFRGNSRLS
jgi:hypothetical protein